jgi:hypothetical protein
MAGELGETKADEFCDAVGKLSTLYILGQSVTA